MMNSLRLYWVVPFTLLFTAGCRVTDDHSPTIDVLGSYFPAWIVCIISGLVLTLIVRQILIALKLDVHVRPIALIYVCLLVTFTLLVWLMFFQN